MYVYYAHVESVAPAVTSAFLAPANCADLELDSQRKQTCECTSEVTLTVAGTLLIEILLAIPIFGTVIVFCFKRR